MSLFIEYKNGCKYTFHLIYGWKHNWSISLDMKCKITPSYMSYAVSIIMCG